MATLRPRTPPKHSEGLICSSRASIVGEKTMRVVPSWISAPGLRKALAMRTPLTNVPFVLSRSAMP